MLDQAEFLEGSLAKSCTCQRVLLIPKGYGKDFCVIGVIEVLWKATTRIINWRLTAAILYHNSLHGLRTGRGTGTTILEYKLLHYLTSMS